MKTTSHYAGLVLLFAPFVHLLYRAIKAKQLGNILRGAIWALAIIVWAALVGYLLSH